MGRAQAPPGLVVLRDAFATAGLERRPSSKRPRVVDVERGRRGGGLASGRERGETGRACEEVAASGARPGLMMAPGIPAGQARPPRPQPSVTEAGMSHGHRHHRHPRDESAGSTHEHGPRADGSRGHAHPHGFVDPSIASPSRGLSVLKWSSAGLLAMALLQAVVIVLSGSVALLANTIHNVVDAATAIPLGIAFWLARRAATRRLTGGSPASGVATAGGPTRRLA